MKPLKEVFLEAADHIEEVGWTQGRFFAYPAPGVAPEEVPCCLIGAVRVATDYYIYSLWDQNAYDAARLALNDRLGGQAAVWNDQEGRTKEEVIAALRAAAEAQP